MFTLNINKNFHWYIGVKKYKQKIKTQSNKVGQKEGHIKLCRSPYVQYIVLKVKYSKHVKVRSDYEYLLYLLCIKTPVMTLLSGIKALKKR